MNEPLVSIITAMYNRSNVLRYTIACVIQSTFTDWEMIIVGDACTDDTEEVVASFGDSRIRFVNLEQNCGEQSGPNNEGFRLSRGKYIAYVNHDDLWFPDHLGICLQAIQETDVEWVYSKGIDIMPTGKFRFCGTYPAGKYHPNYGALVDASHWLVKRETLEKLSGWKYYKDIVLPPAQDLVLRAWKMGIRFGENSQITLLVLPAGPRRTAYKQREYQENKYFCDQICGNPLFRQEIMLKTLTAYRWEMELDRLSVKNALFRLYDVLRRRIVMLFGATVMEAMYYLRSPKKGGYMIKLRKLRGNTNG